MSSPSAGQAPSAAIVCSVCGFADTGSYCSHCGHELRATKPKGVAALLSQAPDFTHARHGVIPVLARMFVRPVTTTMALVDDPAYRGHWTVATITSALYFFVSRLQGYGATDAEKPPPGIVQYVDYSQFQSLLTLAAIVLLFLVTFGVFRLFQRKRADFGRFVKLAALASGFAQLDMSILKVLFFVSQKQTLVSSEGVLLYALFPVAAIVVGRILVYHFRVQRRFWDLSFWGTVLPSILVVAPAFAGSLFLWDIAPSFLPVIVQDFLITLYAIVIGAIVLLAALFGLLPAMRFGSF